MTREPSADADGAPIDAVITWVDGADPEFVRIHADASAKVTPGLGYLPDAPGRHRDSGELLFLVRSIRANAPWIRTIHIVTNGQRPRYLDFSHPDLRLVTHREIFPDPEVLPSFNSFAIDSCLHNIEGLSEKFVRFSDDFFISRPVSRARLTGPERGRGFFVFGGRVQQEPRNAYQGLVLRSAQAFQAATGLQPKRNFAHTPQMREISVCRRMEELFSEELGLTRRHLFRNERDVIPLFLYPYVALLEDGAERLAAFIRKDGGPDCCLSTDPEANWFRQVFVGDIKKPWKRDLDQVLAEPPLFLNLNDHYRPATQEQDVRITLDFLFRLFPHPSPHEVADEVRRRFDVDAVIAQGKAAP